MTHLLINPNHLTYLTQILFVLLVLSAKNIVIR